MDIASLQAFITVADTASFSQAAQRLFLTQPAVSKRVAQLEQELDSRLFDRIGRTITLTEAGRALLPSARRILAEVDNSKRVLHNLAGEVSGPLTIGTSHHIGLHRLPGILRRYSEQYPQVRLDLHFMDSEAACQSVLKGELELGIVTLPLEPLPMLQTYPVWDDPLLFVIGKEHPLATQISLTLPELAKHPAILPAPGTYTRQVLENALRPYHLSLNIGLSTNYLETIKMMVTIGLGWSLLPQTMLNEELKVIEIEELELRRQLGLVHHVERTLSNAARAMKQLLLNGKPT